MPKTILLAVTHLERPSGCIEGFRFMWAFYVNGYRPDRHCQPCFRGRRVEDFCTPTAECGRVLTLDRMDRYPFVYVCGVGTGPRAELRHKNLHFPLRYAAGALAETTTYNGYRFRAENAELVPIPPLPSGWGGKTDEHVRCKNFQFAVAYFGAPSMNALNPTSF
jgi:hypothetical protein